MIVGHHLIWTAYGCWLPNDPRGSSSQEIRVPLIAELGELYRGRKVIQPTSAEIRAFYSAADEVLKHPRLTFTDQVVGLLAESFGQTIQQQRYTCYGCAIMPDHVHMLIRRHRQIADAMIQHFQEDSRQALIAAGQRASDHPVWGGPGWPVFQNSREDMERIVKYIRENPIKAGRPEQRWPFVKPYDGWLPGGWKKY